MKKYEAIFILDSQRVDDHGEAFCKDAEGAITSMGGRVISSERMGRRQFAAPIKKKTAGLYWDLVFESSTANVAKLKERYRLNAAVLRLVVFAYDKPAVTVLEKKRETAEA